MKYKYYVLFAFVLIICCIGMNYKVSADIHYAGEKVETCNHVKSSTVFFYCYPTCTDWGYNAYRCIQNGNGCNGLIIEYTDPPAHKWGSTTTVPPTCTLRGYDKKSCTKCPLVRKTNFKDSLGRTFTYLL